MSAKTLLDVKIKIIDWNWLVEIIAQNISKFKIVY